MRKSNISILLILILSAFFLTLLTGCRHSELLNQVIYTDNAQIDTNNNTELNNNNENNVNEDEYLASKKDTYDSKTERDWKKNEPEKGKAESETPVPDEINDNNAASDKDAVGVEPNQQQDGQTDSQQDSGQNDSGDSQNGTGTEATTNRVLRQIVNGIGETVNVPQSVDKVAAVGSGASMVQMLGGEGRLIASSSSLTKSSLAEAVFSDQNISAVQTLWSGEGNNVMSDSDFQKLISLKPDVCFEISGQTSFSDSQLAELKAKDIYYVVLPCLNTSSNIKSAVNIIGSVLGDKSAKGGTNAPAIADQYCKWYDGIIKKVGQRVKRFNYNDIDFDYDKYANRDEKTLIPETTDGYYSLFISGWSDNTSYKIYSDTYVTMQGTGVAIAPSGYSKSPLSYYMSLAGTVNTAATYADQYQQQLWYVNPLQSSTRIIEFSGNDGVYTNENLTCIKDTTNGSNGTVYLGDKEFPAIIVANNSIKEKIENDAANRRFWTNYGEISSADGKVHGWGFSDEIGQFISTTIRDNYNIYVNPDGVDSWTDGSAEGVLESMWIAMKYYGAFSDSEMRTEVSNFYKTFYHYTLSESQLSQILTGP